MQSGISIDFSNLSISQLVRYCFWLTMLTVSVIMFVMCVTVQHYRRMVIAVVVRLHSRRAVALG